jgi:hypothetical protein
MLLDLSWKSYPFFKMHISAVYTKYPCAQQEYLWLFVYLGSIRVIRKVVGGTWNPAGTHVRGTLLKQSEGYKNYNLLFSSFAWLLIPQKCLLKYCVFAFFSRWLNAIIGVITIKGFESESELLIKTYEIILTPWGYLFWNWQMINVVTKSDPEIAPCLKMKAESSSKCKETFSPIV